MNTTNNMSEFDDWSGNEQRTYDPTVNDIVMRIHELEHSFTRMVEYNDPSSITAELREGMMENISEEITYLYKQLQTTWDAIPDLDVTDVTNDLTNDGKGMYIGDDAFEEVVVVKEPPVTKKKRKAKAKK